MKRWVGYNTNMKTYLLLLRGINVGGKNKIPMATLKRCLETLGFSSVTTYIASGNVVLRSDKKPADIQSRIEAALPKEFALDSELVKVLVLGKAQLEAVVKNKPKGFGDQPKKYHSDVIFLMKIKLSDALAIFNPREGVDTIWPGKEVVYSQRLSAKRTKSRLNVIMISPLYKSMTIRTWNTVVKLLDIMNDIDAHKE